MIKKDLFSCTLLFLVGLYLAYKSSRLSVWSNYGPGEGFFPLAIAIIIMGLSLSIVVRHVLLIAKPKYKEIPKEQHKEARSIYKICSYGFLMVLYGILMEKAGFLIISTSFMFIILKWVEGQSWKATILIGSTSIVVSYLLFDYFLGVPLPKGLLGLQ